jgi:hypothetical protein
VRNEEDEHDLDSVRNEEEEHDLEDGRHWRRRTRFGWFLGFQNIEGKERNGFQNRGKGKKWYKY